MGTAVFAVGGDRVLEAADDEHRSVFGGVATPRPAHALIYAQAGAWVVQASASLLQMALLADVLQVPQLRWLVECRHQVERRHSERQIRGDSAMQGSRRSTSRLDFLAIAKSECENWSSEADQMSTMIWTPPRGRKVSLELEVGAHSS